MKDLQHEYGSKLELELVLLNIFVSDTDSGIDCILSKFADSTRLCGAFHMLEGWDPSRGTWTGLRGGPT